MKKLTIPQEIKLQDGLTGNELHLTYVQKMDGKFVYKGHWYIAGIKKNPKFAMFTAYQMENESYFQGMIVIK